MRMIPILLFLVLSAAPSPADPAGLLDRAREARSLRIHALWRHELREAADRMAVTSDPAVIPAATRLALADGLTTVGLYHPALSIAAGVDEAGLEGALVIEKDRVRGRLTTRLGRFPEGGDCLRRALKRSIEVHGEESPATARVRLDLSEYLRRTGKLRDAYHEAEKAASVLTAGSTAPDPEASVEAMLVLGLAHHELGLLRQAEQLYRQGLEKLARHRAEGTLLHARILRELARLALDSSWIDAAAIPYLEWCLTARRIFGEVLGNDHVETAETQAIHAQLFLAAYPSIRPVFQQAVDELRDVVRIYAATVGTDHPDCLQTRMRLLIFVPIAEGWNRVDVVKRSFDAIYEIMGIQQRMFEPPNPALGWIYCLIGDFYQSVKNKKLMEKYWLRAVRQFEGVGAFSYGARLARTRYAGALMHRKRRRQAVPYLIDVYQTVRLGLGDDHPYTELARLRFHILLEERLKRDDAARLIDSLPDPSSAIGDPIDFERLALLFEPPETFAELLAPTAGTTETVTSSTIAPPSPSVVPSGP